MSSISGIGGAMGISVGAGMSVGAPASAGSGAGAISASSSTQAPGAGMPESLQSLAQTMKDFSSAEILIALMLSGGGRDKDKEGGGGGGAGAFLAGMALAGMMGQQSHLNLQFNMPLAGSGQVGGPAASAGMSLNVTI